MKKTEFITKYLTDYSFRAECRSKGIRVIQNNVIFLDAHGNIKAVAGAYIK